MGIRGPRAVVALGVLMLGLTAALAPTVRGWGDTPLEPAVHVPWIVFALGFAVAELGALHLQFRGSALTFTPDEILFVVGLFVMSPTKLITAYVAAGAFMLGLVRRIKLFKLVFNVGTWALSATAGVVVFRVLADHADATSPRTCVAALAATATMAVISMTAISTAVTLLEGRPADLVRSTAFGLTGTVVDTLLGLGAVVLFAQSPLDLVLLAGPVAIVSIAYRAYMSESSKSRGLEFLYSASELLTSADDLEGGLLAVLDFARQTFHGELAEIVLLGGDDQPATYRTCSGPGERSVLLEAVHPSVAEKLLAIAAESATAELYRPHAGSILALRDGIHVGSAMIAGLTNDSGMRGAVMIARERGAVVDAFDRDQVRLFETFANHLATAIEKSRLSASLAQLRALEQELAHQAYHDSLTGLANRALFHDDVEQALERVARDGGNLSVMFIDLDDFKTVNDTMGHAAGDALLAEVARRIAGCVGAAGTAARLGGDEFAVLLPRVNHELQVRAVADRILVALGDPIDLEGQPVFMHASIGIANQCGAKDAAELMQNADVAMYTAKRNGKGRFDEFQPTMSLSVAHRHRVKVGLERALTCNEFLLHYQPIIDAATGNVLGTEALLRWRDPTRGLMPPAEFVGVAEETGLIVPIGRYVLREACRQAAEWAATTPGLRVFVNLSTRQLSDPDLVHEVKTALIAAGLEPNQLTLEMTETAMMHDIEDALRTLIELKSIGVQLAIDDFGTGFSSLSYLRQLPIDVLKIAKPIIDGICDSDEDKAFVKGIIELGHLIGLQVVAEGVEEVEQYARLVDMGCDFVQGFYYSPSMSPRDAAELLRSLHGAEEISQDAFERDDDLLVVDVGRGAS